MKKIAYFTRSLQELVLTRLLKIILLSLPICIMIVLDIIIGASHTLAWKWVDHHFTRIVSLIIYLFLLSVNRIIWSKGRLLHWFRLNSAEIVLLCSRIHTSHSWLRVTRWSGEEILTFTIIPCRGVKNHVLRFIWA